jgi:hypothetical protein
LADVSDLDFVCDDNMFLSVRQIFEDCKLPCEDRPAYGEKSSTSGNRFTATLCGQKVDVFSVPEEDLELWKITTEVIRGLVRLAPKLVAEKSVRIRLFRMQMGMLKMVREMAKTWKGS